MYEPIKRKPGRPKGSRNRPKGLLPCPLAAPACLPQVGRGMQVGTGQDRPAVAAPGGPPAASPAEAPGPACLGGQAPAAGERAAAPRLAEARVELDAVVQGDCIEWLNGRQPAFADLIFADPPFNIGYKYDVYEDRRACDEYHDWTEAWMVACCRALAPAGTFWIAIGDEYAAEVRLIGRKLGLTLRNWVIWHYTFGQNTVRKFARSHAHLFYFVKDPAAFTFNEMAVRVFSDRQREYHDKRANPEGKLPDDTWSEFSRVCGTFREREGWHPCQMPETVLSRIVRATSNVGDLVFDPFAGSGTTLVVAKRLSRRWLGTEISANYVEGIRKRLAETNRIAECPPTGGGPWPEEHIRELQGLYVEAGVTTDLLYEHRHLLDAFTAYLNWRLQNAGVQGQYEAPDVWDQLERLRRDVKLGRIKVFAEEPPSRTARSPGQFLFA